jgi:hypothetical protein
MEHSSGVKIRILAVSNNARAGHDTRIYCVGAFYPRPALKDLSKIKGSVLKRLLETSAAQLEQCRQNVDDMKELLPGAKNARERTALNILLDDQKKVAKALERLVADLEAETADETAA